MLKCFLAAFLAMSVMTLATARAVNAQSRDADQTRKIEKLKAEIIKLGVGPKARVQIKLRDGAKFKGYIRDVRDDDFVVVDEKTGVERVVPYAQVAQLKGSNGLTAVKVGITAAKAVGVVAAVAAISMLFMYLIVPKS